MHFCRVLSIFLGVDSGKIVVCAGVFLQCSLGTLYRGATEQGILAGLFRYSFAWSLEKS